MTANIVGGVLVAFGVLYSFLAGRFAERQGGSISGGALFCTTFLPILTGVAIINSGNALWWLVAAGGWFIVAAGFGAWTLLTFLAPAIYGWILWGWIGAVGTVVASWLLTSAIVRAAGLSFPQGGDTKFTRRGMFT